MWYSRRWMKLIFYLGVAVAVIGLGVYTNVEFRNLGILLVCIGVAAVVLGFSGLIFNGIVDNAYRNKKK